MRTRKHKTDVAFATRIGFRENSRINSDQVSSEKEATMLVHLDESAPSRTE